MSFVSGCHVQFLLQRRDGRRRNHESCLRPIATHVPTARCPHDLCKSPHHAAGCSVRQLKDQTAALCLMPSSAFDKDQRGPRNDALR